MGNDWPFGLLGAGRHGVIYADPPWHFTGYTDEGSGVPQHGGEQHYSTMTVERMAEELPVHKLAAPDCALFMWTTSSHTPQAFWLARRWGFRYASKAFTWAKLNKHSIADEKLCNDPTAYFMGMGHGTRRQTEDCYLFTRGKPKRRDAGVRELIVSPIREHSRKPDEAYSSIERLFDGPYCELFSRNAREGWSSWGNEVGKFTE